MATCPRCKRKNTNTLLLSFYQNKVVCVGCTAVEKFVLRAGAFLFMEFKSMDLNWSIAYTKNPGSGKVSYNLRRNDEFFGKLTDCLGGVIHLSDFNGDEAGLIELQKALYGAFGVVNLSVNNDARSLLTYIP